jgi:hypothetical protein
MFAYGVVDELRAAARKTPAVVDRVTGAHRATYPTVTRVTSWVILVLTFAISTFVASRVQSTRGLLIGGTISALIVPIAVAIVMEFTQVRVEWTASGIAARTPWNGPRRLRWEDLVSVRYSKLAGWFVIRDSRGGVVRVSQLLSGVGELLETMEQRVNPSVRGQIDVAVARYERAVRRGTG